MFGDRYKNLMSSVAFMPDGEGAVADAPETPPAGDQAPPAADTGAGDAVKPAGDAPAGDQPPAKPKGRGAEAVFQDRIGELTRHRREAERKAAEASERATKLENELRAAQELLQTRGRGEGDDPAKPTPARRDAPPGSADDFLNTAEGKAAVKAQAATEARAAEISRRGDEIYDQAEKEFGKAKLEKALGNFKAFDGLRVELAEAIFDVSNSHRVLYEIGSDPDTIDKLYKLADSNPVKMAIEVAKIAARVESKPAARRVSDAPEPPEVINGRGNTGPVDLNDKDLPMSKWVEEREKDLKKRGVRL
jgi:hypothetical protein